MYTLFVKLIIDELPTMAGHVFVYLYLLFYGEHLTTLVMRIDRVLLIHLLFLARYFFILSHLAFLSPFEITLTSLCFLNFIFKMVSLSVSILIVPVFFLQYTVVVLLNSPCIIITCYNIQLLFMSDNELL